MRRPLCNEIPGGAVDIILETATELGRLTSRALGLPESEDGEGTYLLTIKAKFAEGEGTIKSSFYPPKYVASTSIVKATMEQERIDSLEGAISERTFTDLALIATINRDLERGVIWTLAVKENGVPLETRVISVICTGYNKG